MKPRHLSWAVFAALALGVATGLLLEGAPAHVVAAATATFVTLSTIFLNLVKMVVGPLILATLISGIAHAGDGRSIVRVGGKALLWFLAASIVSLTIGTAGALILQPGAGLNLVDHGSLADTGLKTQLSVQSILTDAFPVSIANALATNNILQIVVFSMFAGAALSALGARGAVLSGVVGQLAELMLKMTGYIMVLAPIAVFAAIANVVMTQGAKIMGSFAYLIIGYYGALGTLLALMGVVAWAILGKDLPRLLRLVREPAVVAFSTSSSEAAYPRLLAALEGFGVPRRIAGFVLPLGYSFNLDASMMYCTFGSLFVAQAYGVHLSGGEIVMLMLTLMLASKGIAAVPRGSLVALAVVLPQFNLPAGGILLLLGIDHLLNMGRSGANVFGNALAVVAIWRWEPDSAAEPQAVPPIATGPQAA